MPSQYADTHTTNRSAVFCANGGTNPAHSLRILLLRAGIESNPGPPCETCGVSVKTQHLDCRMGCGNVCHKRPGCSRIKRDALDSTTWLCTEHNPNPTQTALPCEACGVDIRAKAKHLICNEAEGCSIVCHKKPECSRIKRNVLDSTPWLCKVHNPTRSQMLPPVAQQHQHRQTRCALNAKSTSKQILSSAQFVILVSTSLAQVSTTDMNAREEDQLGFVTTVMSAQPHKPHQPNHQPNYYHHLHLYRRIKIRAQLHNPVLAVNLHRPNFSYYAK